MSQSITLTTSQTFTIADARYLASRISSALTQLRLHYGDSGGYLTNQKIEDLTVEAAVLLKYGLLDTVKYGFQRNNEWIAGIMFKVNSLNQLELPDDQPGGIFAQADVSGASWSSYLIKRSNPDISSAERSEIIESLPVQRTSGGEPGSANGSWDDDRTHYRNGVGMQRSQFRS